MSMKNLDKKERDMEFIMTYLIAFVCLGIGIVGFIQNTIDPLIYVSLAAFLSTERDVLDFFKRVRK